MLFKQRLPFSTGAIPGMHRHVVRGSTYLVYCCTCNIYHTNTPIATPLLLLADRAASLFSPVLLSPAHCKVVPRVTYWSCHYMFKAAMAEVRQFVSLPVDKCHIRMPIFMLTISPLSGFSRTGGSNSPSPGMVSVLNGLEPLLPINATIPLQLSPAFHLPGCI